MSTLRIISRSDETFRDREEAGVLLAQELREFAGGESVVVGIPRGGVIIAWKIAQVLETEFDILLSHKIGAPGNPEFAIGAISESGDLFINESVARVIEGYHEYINQEKERQLAEIERRRELFRSVHPKVSLKDRIVIVTDDGVATGATMQAALWAVRRAEPRQLIAALPVGPEDTLQVLAKDADQVICLRAPAFFSAVGQFYSRFEQVEDNEVLELLRACLKINWYRDK